MRWETRECWETFQKGSFYTSSTCSMLRRSQVAAEKASFTTPKKLKISDTHVKPTTSWPFFSPLHDHLTAAKESSELIKWKQKHQRVKIYGKISSCRQRRMSWLLCVSPLNCQEINKNIEITPMARARPRQWHWYLRRNLPLYLVQLHRLNNSSHEPNESRKVAKRSLAHQMCCVYIFKLYAGLLISFAEKSAFLSLSHSNVSCCQTVTLSWSGQL